MYRSAAQTLKSKWSKLQPVQTDMTKNKSTAPAQPEWHAQKWSLLYQNNVCIGLPGKTTKKVPKAELYQNPFPLLLMPLLNCPHFTPQLCCGALVLNEKQKND